MYDARRAAKLADDHHQGALQQAALLEIDEQRGQRLIETRQAPAHAIRAVAEGVAHAHVAAVHVPARTGRSAQLFARRRARPAIDGDEPDSRLDEPARQQQVLSQGMHAVAVAHGRGLSFHLERLAPARSARQLKGPAVQILPISQWLDFRRGARGRIQAVQQPAAFLHALGRHRRKQLVGSFEARHGRVIGCRADEQRAVDQAQVAARADIRGAEDGIADALDQPDVGGDVALAGSNLGQDGTDVRSVGGRIRLAAQAVVHGVEMVADVADVRHRPDQAEMLGQRGQARVQLADAHAGDRRGDRLVGAANFRGRLGLQVPGIEVAGPAAQQDEDARLLGGTAAKSSVAIDARRNHPRAPESSADPAGLEKSAAGDHGGPLSPVAERWIHRSFPGTRVVLTGRPTYFTLSMVALVEEGRGRRSEGRGQRCGGRRARSQNLTGLIPSSLAAHFSIK